MKRSYKIIGLIWLIICLWVSLGLAEEFKGMVAFIKDGDTIELSGRSKTEEIRIADIDCPETNQAYGYQAKQMMYRLAFMKEVEVRRIGKDKYGRTIAQVFVDGKNVGEELVKNGCAWWFEKYSSNQRIKGLEVEARQKKVGLWAQNNPTPPWQWRAEHQARKKEVAEDSDPQEAVVSSNVGQKTIYTGPRGGKFYVNSHGNKSYIRRK